MSDPLDFSDGILRCDKCGANFLEEDAKAALWTRYESTSSVYGGRLEWESRQIVICPECYRRLLRWERFLQLRNKFLSYLVIALLLGAMALVVYLSV